VPILVNKNLSVILTKSKNDVLNTGALAKTPSKEFIAKFLDNKVNSV
jgi:hypothetical protein